jgi:hypothetical protein
MLNASGSGVRSAAVNPLEIHEYSISIYGLSKFREVDIASERLFSIDQISLGMAVPQVVIL